MQTGKKEDKRKNDGRMQLREITGEVGNSILTAYFFVMMVLFPLYIKGGYLEIGNAKYYFFRNVSFVTAGILLIIMICRLFLQKENFHVTAYYKSLSVTDWFVYGYFISLLLSYLAAAYKKEAFWGANGWYMGFASQLLFIMIYFLFSRYFRWDERLLYVILSASGLVFLLGILNRYSIYPLAINGQTPTFIATLGNINWFCGYWAVICPLGILCYWNSESKLKQAAAGSYVIIGFLIGVVQGSSSAFLALTGIFVFLFSISFRENQKMCRFLEIGIMFAAACQMARLFRYLPNFEMNYENELGILLTDTNITFYIGLILGGIYLLFRYLAREKGCQIARYKYIRSVGLFLLLTAAAGYIILLVINTSFPDAIPGLSGKQMFTFNDTWASSRGATWTIGMLAYRNMSPLHKLIGIGPDCFTEYIYAVPELAERTYAQFGSSRLTNAHNEWITVLVNQGILGIVCYAGFFLAAFVRFIRKAPLRPVLYLCAASLLTYTVHNMVSFQQVLNVPFVFIILGIGEGVCRSITDSALDVGCVRK